MVQKINHKQLQQLIDVYYNHKKFLMIYGRFGIGKSHVLLQKAKEIAKEKDKIFKEWNKISLEEKELICRNPELYFVFLDIRLSEYDPSDIKGIPDLKEDNVIWKSPLFCKLVSNDKADGILFFDEINLAPNLVITSVYKIVYDRIINEDKLSVNFGIFAAGNIEDDKAATHRLPPPVRDRGGEVELLGSSAEEWLDWAAKNNIDQRIIGYILYSKEKLWVVDMKDTQKFTTYRGWERLSELIVSITSNYELLQLVSTSAISESIGIDFTAFCKIKEDIDIEKIIKNPEELKKIDKIDQKFFIISAISSRYKDKAVTFENIIKISTVLDEIKDTDFIALLWKMCLRYDFERFMKEFESNSEGKKLANKFAKYILS